MPGVLFILGGVAVRLPLFYADAYGKGFGFHGHPPAVQHLKGVPGGVTGAEDQLPAGEGMGAGSVRNGDAPQRPLPDVQIRQVGFKAEVTPQSQQFLPQVFQGDVEIIRPHMGLGVVENLLRRPAFNQFLQNKTVTGIFGAGVQLAVGKGAGAALPELDVAGEIQFSG